MGIRGWRDGRATEMRELGYRCSAQTWRPIRRRYPALIDTCGEADGMLWSSPMCNGSMSRDPAFTDRVSVTTSPSAWSHAAEFTGRRWHDVARSGAARRLGQAVPAIGLRTSPLLASLESVVETRRRGGPSRRPPRRPSCLLSALMLRAPLTSSRPRRTPPGAGRGVERVRLCASMWTASELAPVARRQAMRLGPERRERAPQLLGSP